MQPHDDIQRELLADTAVQVSYQDLAAEFDRTGELIAARSRVGLTLAEAAPRRMP